MKYKIDKHTKQLFCEYYKGGGCYNSDTNEKHCSNNKKWLDCYGKTLCYLKINTQGLKNIKDRNTIWALQNLQSNDFIDKEVAKFIIQRD